MKSSPEFGLLLFFELAYSSIINISIFVPNHHLSENVYHKMAVLPKNQPRSKLHYLEFIAIRWFRLGILFYKNVEIGKWKMNDILTASFIYLKNLEDCANSNTLYPFEAVFKQLANV